MFEWDMKKRVIAGSVAVLLGLTAVGFAVLYQPESKTEEIYKSALADFNAGKYQNSYYLFSKISMSSNLKPVAIYHRAECAKMLGDDKSELKQYEFLFNTFPKHKLSLKARYLAAQKLVEQRPDVAKKYFEHIIKYAPNTDYAIASEYYMGVLLKNKYKDKKIIPASVKDDVQDYFRHYIKQSPSGRHALNAVKLWLEFVDNISQDDYLLMANTCYLFDENNMAKELLEKTDIHESWVLDVKNSYKLGNYARVKSIAETGIQKYTSYVDEEQLINAIDIYNNVTGSNSVSRLLGLVPSGSFKGRDYLMYLKCQNVAQSDKTACFSKLYLEYPNGRFSAEALSNIFFAKIKSGNISDAKKVGEDHLRKFQNVNSTPMVMFWLGKLYEKTNDYDKYNYYYRDVIDKYPDSYYAYRAYLRLRRIQTAIITSNISPQPVVYPYRYTKNNIIVKLVNLGDYNIVNEFSGNDEFIKSWVLYKKGDYSNSMLKARDAMDKLEDKPDKYDMRWRLVYPIMYYEFIKKYSDATGNNLPLIVGLIREESYFEPLAQSSVGASGLMQLMPATANEINSKFTLGMSIPSDLFNPEYNIKLGNYYYKFLRSNLEGYDISAVAAYNGGIGSLKTWKTSINYNDTDEFVEQIPYAETKNYVKKVFRSYWNYIRIYSGNN